MKTSIFLIIFSFSTLYGWIDKGEYIKKLKTIPPISYHELCVKYLKPHPLFPKNTSIEDEFLSWDEDSNSTAIDFDLVGMNDIVKITPNYAVVLYDDGFDKYAILLDNKMKIQNILLLAYRKGNSEWQLEREVEVKPERNILFLVDEQYRGTEWITSQKGAMIVLEERVYVVNINNSNHFEVKKTNYYKLYKQQDKKLNQNYKYLMQNLDKDKKIALKNTQKAWLKYITLKCNNMIKNVLDLPKHSLYVQSYKSHCLYEETKRRNKELKSIVNYWKFYK